ncbi:MAG: hypothetical protein AUJ06_02045 [Chloroflexi bacterium 13_1_40CM_3_70_6]|nr:MAG: hypothetical protein AUJ06_02045 [Chloroflexi bacterium 13_1_40CM_3_70_6]
MKVRVALCGGVDLAASAETLGLEAAREGQADIALVDLREPGSIAQAAALPPTLPRVVVVSESQQEIAGALGFPRGSVSTSCEAAVLGPLIAAALPPAARRATRSLLITAARGGVGRSLLAANIVRRLATSRSTIGLDLTGSGVLAWWLGANAASWSELEDLTEELTAEHLAVVASETAPGLRVVGGPPCAPSPRLGRAALRVGLELAEIVVVDAPILAEVRIRELLAVVDRVLVLTYDDPVSLGALDAADLPDDVWLVASQSAATALAGRDVFRAIPRAEGAIAAAAAGRGAVGGDLGKAYDELTELIAIDAA